LGKVRSLPPELVSKIAAGEVIERPASVVKELVENSLDAGAGRVRVELIAGGKRSVRVIDDGEGMAPEDAELAIQRHATSKISSEEDLQRIVTLGFRGEALAAMASVSRLSLVSRAEGCPAVRLYVEGGELKERAEVGAPRGTQVEVKDLFFNLPARRKFLKGTGTELGHCLEAVVRMALAYPQVAFSALHEGRRLMELPPVKEERDRVAAVLGRELHPHLTEVEGSEGAYSIRGWVTLPPYARGNTRGIYLYVNGRYVRDRLLQRVLGEVYGGLLPRGTYPVAVLKLQLPPEEVDVNIHPTKMEVKFRDPQRVYELLRGALERALAPTTWSPKATAPPPPPPELREAPTPYAPTLPMAPPEERPRLRPLGQIGGTYILVEGEEGLLIVDQHAAHERVLYERLRGEEVPCQRLLLPQVVELSEGEVEALLGQREVLGRCGFELEAFGPRTLAVKAIPTLIRAHEVKQVLQALAGELEEASEDGLERARKLLACRGAIKANTPLGEEDMRRLLEELEATPHPRTCPHGRPTAIEITLEELARRFKRE